MSKPFLTADLLGCMARGVGVTSATQHQAPGPGRLAVAR